jgi:hypothetical protein
MYDNSRQRSAVLPLVAAWVGAGLAGMVLRKVRADRAARRGDVPGRPGRPGRRTAAGARSRGRARGPVG